MNPLTTARNKYHENRKDSSIYTPLLLSKFIFDTIVYKYKKIKIVVDPACGSGNLLKWWSEYGCNCFGFDIKDDMQRDTRIIFQEQDFLSLREVNIDPDLVIVNPPFNNDFKGTKKGKKLLPELFLNKIWNLYGKEIPCVCFCPMGLRLNQRTFSSRWKMMRDDWPCITSVISLPLNIFPNVEFHNEVLIFNLPELKPHYFLPEEYIEI
jgi:type I restriction enzyme M protein